MGLLVHHVWPGSIQKVKRGPRKQRQHVDLNLSRNDPAPKQHQDSIPLSDELAGISISSDWKMIMDKTNFVSFVQTEKWEFNNVRVVTEVDVSKTANSANAFITIKAHGCQKDLRWPNTVCARFTDSVSDAIKRALGLWQANTINPSILYQMKITKVSFALKITQFVVCESFVIH